MSAEQPPYVTGNDFTSELFKAELDRLLASLMTTVFKNQDEFSALRFRLLKLETEVHRLKEGLPQSPSDKQLERIAVALEKLGDCIRVDVFDQPYLAMSEVR